MWPSIAGTLAHTVATALHLSQAREVEHLRGTHCSPFSLHYHLLIFPRTLTFEETKLGTDTVEEDA